VNDPADLIQARVDTAGLQIFADGSDTITLNYTGGSLGGPVQLNGAGGADTLSVLGGGVGLLSITGGTINIATNVNGMDIDISNSAQVNFGASQHLRSLSLTTNGVARLNPGGNKVLAVDTFITFDVLQGIFLDLADNDLILRSNAQNRQSGLQLIRGACSARSLGTWKNVGLTSSMAAADPKALTTLGITLNDYGQGTPIYTTFAGESVGVNDILVKYTYYGDADLNGRVDADDYFLIDRGFTLNIRTNVSYDFDFNRKIDASDYFLIDRAYVGQVGALAAGETVAASTQWYTKTLTPSLSRSTGREGDVQALTPVLSHGRAGRHSRHHRRK